MTESDRVRRILEETERQILTDQLEGGFSGDLVITPGCLENMLWYVADIYLQDSSLISGTSPWKEKLGEQVAAPLVNFTLVAEHQRPGASKLSGDGYVADNMYLIEAGVLKNFSLSRYGASKTGLKRSANSGTTMVFGNGDTPLEELIAGVEKGFYWVVSRAANLVRRAI